ncbi:MAG: type II toxin-antitoxin system VapC family toxin [Gemmatimonadales bacterium]
MKTVFVDTSGLYAALDPTDPYHREALEAFRRAEDERWHLLTTRFVVVEVWALVQSRKGWDSVDVLLNGLLPRCEVVEVDPRLHELGAARCRQARSRWLSLTGGVSLEFMQSNGIREAIVADRDFAAAGIRHPA